MKQRFYLVIALIVLAAALLRLIDLGDYPQRFNQDEMAQGYDAWSIWRTGHDQHGAFLPLQFRNFNDYVPPVANYLTAPFVGLLGLDETTTRLPAALAGILTVALVGLLGRLWFGDAAGLAAALLLTFEPWHLNYSRIAFPASFVPLFTVIALYAYTRGVQALVGHVRHSLSWLAASALSFALLTATYSTMKLEAPLLILVCLLAGASVWQRQRRAGLVWLLLIALFVSPYVLDQITHWQATQGRFDSISVFQHADWPALLWTNYRAHYDLQALFVDGLREGVAVHPPGIGELFWLEAPLMLIGLAGLFRRQWWQRNQLIIPVVVILWLLTFPVAASLTNQGIPHEIRTYNLLPLPELLAGYGLACLWEWTPTRRRARWLIHVALAAGLVTFVLFNGSFLTYFFGARQEIYDNVGLRPALEAVQAAAQPCDLIWMEPTSQQPYMYFLFLTRTPPEQFQQARIQKNPDLWLNIKWFNNVRFGNPDSGQMDVPPTPGCERQPSRTFFVTRRPSLPEGWQDLIVTRSDSDGVLWRAAIQTKSN